MWAGRFTKELNAQANSFNSSIGFDSRMFREDIRGSLAHAEMLAASGIIGAEDLSLIRGGLGGILEDLESGKLKIDENSEDIHMFIEAQLTSRIGDAGKRLHTARSRNDQVALDLRLYLLNKIPELVGGLRLLTETLCKIAEEHTETVMPGYTHLQRAQPVSFGQHLMAYAQMFLRDRGRLCDCMKRMRENPLGSGALAGTTYPIDRFMTSELLGLGSPSANSLDGVSDRDFCVEFLSALSLIMTHLSRFSEEIILWCSWEFKFIELDDGFATGSSIMPQKKNPDIAELVRGKTGRVYGGLLAVLTMLKGLPLAYNKDMQEDKEAVFDALDTVQACLGIFSSMLGTMAVLKENMRAAAARGFINATDCADYLVKKGLPFRDAYKITGGLVAKCVAEGKTLETLDLGEFREGSPLFDEDVYAAINLENCLRGRLSYGGPSPESVRNQIELVRGELAAWEK
jgi:argininosuccinate lyase